MEAVLSPAVIEALAIVSAAEEWNVNDDLCDCANQRTFSIHNPYHGVREEVRLCCLFAELRQMWPQHFRTTAEMPVPWDGETDMPRSIWHRQVAQLAGISVSEARDLRLDPPIGLPHVEKPAFLLPRGGEYVEVRLG